MFTRSGNVLCQRVVLKYQAIQRCRDEFPVRMMSRLLKASASGYYDWEGCPVGVRQADNEQLLERICQMHAHRQGALGAPCMQEELTDEGETASVKRVARLMEIEGLQGWPRKKTRGQRGKSGLAPPDVKNLLERDFTAWEPECKWVTDITDITDIKTGEGKLYLCVVLDLYSKLVVGWSMYRRQDRQLVIRAVEMTVWQRSGGWPVI